MLFFWARSWSIARKRRKWTGSVRVSLSKDEWTEINQQLALVKEEEKGYSTFGPRYLQVVSVAPQTDCGGDTTGPLDLLRTKLHLLDQCRWISIRLRRCPDSRLARTRKGNRRERARTRMARAKARAKKVTRVRIRSRYPNLSNSKDTAGRYCDKWGHKRVDCRKRIADAKSKGGAAAASADDGDVAAVMEVDDVVIRTRDDETSTGWCFTLTSMCAVVGSTGSLLLDGGSDEHLCTPKFADLIPTSRDRSLLKLKDVQQNDLVISGEKTVPMLVGPTGGKHVMEATATFRVAEVRDNILSLGKLVRKGFNFTLGPCGCSMEKDGTKVPLHLKRNSLRVDAHVLQRASRPGYVAAGLAITDERDERMDGMDVKESHSSSSSGPAVEPSAEAGTTPAPELKTWSSIIPGYVTWEPRFTGRRTCSSDGCVNMNRLQPGRRRKTSIWNRGGMSWRWLQNR